MNAIAVALLVGRRYYITPTFIKRMHKKESFFQPQGSIATVMDVKMTDKNIVIDLQWPGGGILVYLDDLVYLVAL